VEEHVRGVTGLCICDVLASCSYEKGFRLYCRIMRQRGDIFEQEVSDPCAGRAGEDGVLEGLWSGFAPRAGWVSVLVAP